MNLDLTPEQVRLRRLSDRDMSDAAGFDVISFDLSDFPHFDKCKGYDCLVNWNDGAEEEKFFEREYAVELAFVSRHVFQAGKSFPDDIGASVGKHHMAHMQMVWERGNEPEQHKFDHFESIIQNGFVHAHDVGSPIFIPYLHRSGKLSKTVFPGVLNEHVNVGELFRPTAAILLRDERSSKRDVWAKMAGIDPLLLANCPDDDWATLLHDCRQRRHLYQFSFESKTGISQFYLDLDAELTARHQLRRIPAAHATLEAALHARFMDLLFNPIPSWIAPSIEAMESGRRPKHFVSVVKAVLELRYRIGWEIDRITPPLTSSTDLQTHLFLLNARAEGKGDVEEKQICFELAAARFEDLRASSINRDPSQIISSLLRVLEGKTIDDSFTRDLGERVVTAARYFNPELLRADPEPFRRTMSITSANFHFWR